MAAQIEGVSPTSAFARPTPETFWLGPQQAAALQHLAGDSRLRLLVGPLSSGKSTILRQYQRAVEGAVALPISGPQNTAAGVLATLLAAARLGPFSPTEIEQRNLLTTFLRNQSLDGKRIILCIDNVSGFSPDAWTEIERLRLVPLANKLMVELAVVGTDSETAHSPLGELLYESTTSAIEAVHFLSPTSDEDAACYIAWWLSRFGLAKHFSDRACQLINRLAGGRYSLINILCQLTLKEHREYLARNIDTHVVRKTVVALATLANEAGRSVRMEPQRATTPAHPAPKKHRRLIVSCGGTVVREMELCGRLLIGSAKDADLRLQDPLVNRYHALITTTPKKGYYIADLHSVGGITVNEQSVRRTALHDGDVIRVGPFRLTVEPRVAPPKPAIARHSKPHSDAAQRSA